MKGFPRGFYSTGTVCVDKAPSWQGTLYVSVLIKLEGFPSLFNTGCVGLAPLVATVKFYVLSSILMRTRVGRNYKLSGW
jgi:hypothetical protein